MTVSSECSLTPWGLFRQLALSQVLIKSRTLFRAWRVGYVEAENEISPRKPLYFWRDNYKGIRLSQNTCLRLL